MSKALTDEQVEALHLAYVQHGTYRGAARAVGVSTSTARTYLKAEVEDSDSELVQVRTQKRRELATELWDAAIVLIQAMVNSKKISDADLRDIATALGITIDKLQLVTGQATQRHEHRELDRQQAERLAQQYGLDPNQVISEAERHLADARQGIS